MGPWLASITSLPCDHSEFCQRRSEAPGQTVWVGLKVQTLAGEGDRVERVADVKKRGHRSPLRSGCAELRLRFHGLRGSSGALS
jgi:hypothetical protein